MRDVSTTAAPIRSSRIDHDWPAVIAAMVGLIFSTGTLTIYSFGVFVHPLHVEFGWNRTQLGGAVAISQFGLAIALPFWGSLVDRSGPRPILFVSVATMSLLTASLALLTPHLWHLYLVFAGIPLLAAGASPLGYSSVLVRRFDRRLGLALGLATMGVGLGAAILPPLAQALIGALGWRDAYAVIGLITLLVGLPSVIIATRHTHGPVVRQVGTAKLPTLPAIRTLTFLLMCVVFFLLGVTTVGVLAQLVPMMIDRGFSPAAAARVAALTGLAALASRGGIGWVLDRVQAPRVIAVVALLACVSFLLLAFGGGRPSSYFAVVLLGGAIGAEVNFIAFLTRRHFTQALFGRLYGIGFGIYLFGGGVGPLLLGISFDHLGGYRPSLLLFTVLAATAAAVTLRIPKNEIRCR